VSEPNGQRRRGKGISNTRAGDSASVLLEQRSRVQRSNCTLWNSKDARSGCGAVIRDADGEREADGGAARAKVVFGGSGRSRHVGSFTAAVYQACCPAARVRLLGRPTAPYATPLPWSLALRTAARMSSVRSLTAFQMPSPHSCNMPGHPAFSRCCPFMHRKPPKTALEFDFPSSKHGLQAPCRC
jgi:hypothetical protein